MQAGICDALLDAIAIDLHRQWELAVRFRW